MKKFSFAFILIQFCFIASPQQFMLTLSPDSLVFTNAGFYVSKVIDARLDTSSIGEIKKGAFNKPMEANITKGVSKGIFEYLNFVIRSKNDAVPITVMVRQLNVSEVHEFYETAKDELILEFYKADGKLLFISHPIVSKPGADVTKFHEQLVKDLVKKAIRQFNLFDWQDGIYENIFTISNRDSIMLNAMSPARGFYSCLEDFQANRPVYTPDFDIMNFNEAKILEGETKKMSILFKDASIQRTYFLDNIWGFSDGKYVYFKGRIYGNKFGFNVIREPGRYCYFKGTITTAEATSGFVGGVAGAIPTKEEYIMDITNGNISLLSDEYLETLLSQEKDLYQSYKTQGFNVTSAMKGFWIGQLNARYIEKWKQ